MKQPTDGGDKDVERRLAAIEARFGELCSPSGRIATLEDGFVALVETVCVLHSCLRPDVEPERREEALRQLATSLTEIRLGADLMCEARERRTPPPE